MSELEIAGVLPSYSAATAGSSQDGGGVDDYNNDYADFTIGDLRAQILANAAIIKPIFEVERDRTEYELELVLLRTRTTRQHYTMLLRRNLAQKRSEDHRNGKAILKAEPRDSPRRAFEAMLVKTEEILVSMVDRGKITPTRPEEMVNWRKEWR